MAENNLEVEIAELSRQIENKKHELELENGIEREEKEVVAETLVEHFYQDSTAPDPEVEVIIPNPVPAKPSLVDKDYLDSLPPEITEVVNVYISMIPKDGIRKTIKSVQTDQPFIIDAFHDALVTRLYDELKERGIVK